MPINTLGNCPIRRLKRLSLMSCRLQAAAGQSSELGNAEVSGPVLRMYAGNMQRLAAQVIAHPCHNALVLQQSHETVPVQVLAVDNTNVLQ